MRLVLWNCGGGLGTAEKISYFKSFKADIAILPELRYRNIEQLSPDDSIWTTNGDPKKNPKGLGVLSFNGFKLKELERDPEFEIYLPVKVIKNDFKFNLLAVWNFYSACKGGRYKGVEGIENDALEYFKPIFRDPCVIAGDWNIGPTLSFARGAHFEIVRFFGRIGIRSLYHAHSGEKQGAETMITHMHNRGGPHIIDHVYGTKFFYNHLHSFEVHPFAKVVGSDHAPMLLELKTAILKGVG